MSCRPVVLRRSWIIASPLGRDRDDNERVSQFHETHFGGFSSWFPCRIICILPPTYYHTKYRRVARVIERHIGRVAYYRMIYNVNIKVCIPKYMCLHERRAIVLAPSRSNIIFIVYRRTH